MEEIQWRVKLCESTVLTPNSTNELVFHYSNRNEYFHQIRSISIAPTWDLAHKLTKTVNIEIPPGETKQLPSIEVKTPTALGGKQGVRFGCEVQGYDTDSDTDYKQLWGKSLLRVDVRNSDVYRPIFCVSGENGDDSIIRQLVHNWGFDVREVYDQEEISDLYKEKALLKPSAVDTNGVPNTERVIIDL